jgi:hypothetical protein
MTNSTVISATPVATPASSGAAPGGSSESSVGRAAIPPGPPVGIDQLMRMSQEQLDELFMQSPAGEIPGGAADGVAIIGAGGFWRRLVSRIVRRFVWQGKTFAPAEGQLINRVTLLSIPLIKANVYQGESWLDRKPCIVLDYSKTSLIARKVRDEIRLVGDGVYLGKVYFGKARLLDFALRFSPAAGERRLPDDAWYRAMFLVSAAWNLVGGVVLWAFMGPIFRLSHLAAPDPPVWYYCWIALFMTFGVGILSVYRDMYRNKAFLPIGIIGKVSFSIIYLYFYLARPGTAPAFVLIGVVGDLVFAALYARFLRFAANLENPPTVAGPAAVS